MTPASHEPTAIDPRLRELTLLYVEDEQKVRENTLSFLEKRFKQVITAENGEIGLKLFQDLNPDIVLTDIKMPVMDGLDMGKYIRQIDKDVPIIIATAFTNEEFYLAAIEVGINKYIKKPIRYSELMDAFVKAAEQISPRMDENPTRDYIFSFFDKAPEPIIIVNNEQIFYMNRRFLDFTGFESLDDFYRSGFRTDSLLHFEEQGNRKELECICESGSAIESLHAQLCNRTGECKRFHVTVSKLERVCKFIVMFKADASFTF